MINNILKALIDGFIIGFVMGAVLSYSVVSLSDRRKISEAITQAKLESAQLRLSIEAENTRLETALSTTSAAREQLEIQLADAEQRIDFHRQSVRSHESSTRRPLAPSKRAEVVAKLVRASESDVIAELRDDRPGFWIAEPVMIDLQAARSASGALRAQIVELESALMLAKEADLLRDREQAILTEVAAKWKASYEAESDSKSRLIASTEQYARPFQWYESPVLWGVVGVAVGAAATAIVVMKISP